MLVAGGSIAAPMPMGRLHAEEGSKGCAHFFSTPFDIHLSY